MKALADILSISVAQRTKEQNKQVEEMGLDALKLLLDHAHMISETTIVGGDDICKSFLKRCHTIAIDEAAASTEPEIYEVYKGGPSPVPGKRQKCALIGDRTHIPPAFFSHNAKDKNRVPVNSLTSQGTMPLMAGLQERNWRVWEQPEQLRMPQVFSICQTTSTTMEESVFLMI
jgi:hypothetical protein